MIRVAVCDDDAGFLSGKMRMLLSRAIKASGIQSQTEVKFFVDGMRLLSEFENHRIYDVVILDIDMPSINGKELAARLRRIDNDFCLAFMSAYKEEVYDTIPLRIDAFIPKDFDADECLRSMIRLFEDRSYQNPEYEFLEILQHGKQALIKISVYNIYYFQCTDNQIIFRTYNETFVLKERTFEKVISQYISKGFYRIHRNCIVNVSKVYEVLETDLVMDNKETLPISRRNRKGLLREIAVRVK